MQRDEPAPMGLEVGQLVNVHVLGANNAWGFEMIRCGRKQPTVLGRFKNRFRSDPLDDPDPACGTGVVVNGGSLARLETQQQGFKRIAAGYQVSLVAVRGKAFKVLQFRIIDLKPRKNRFQLIEVDDRFK